MNHIHACEEWYRFFKKYRELPELWQTKHGFFRNRDRKKKAWIELLKYYRCIVPDATVEQLKSRINIIRTCYRREQKRIEESQKSGASADDIYVPSLWYFEHLNFLRDQDEVGPYSSTMDFYDEESIDRSPNLAEKMTNTDTRDESVQLVNMDVRESSYQTSKDEAAIYSDAWACGFRKLTQTYNPSFMLKFTTSKGRKCLYIDSGSIMNIY